MELFICVMYMQGIILLQPYCIYHIPEGFEDHNNTNDHFEMYLTKISQNSGGPYHLSSLTKLSGMLHRIRRTTKYLINSVETLSA